MAAKLHQGPLWGSFMKRDQRLMWVAGLACTFTLSEAAFAFGRPRWRTVDQPGMGGRVNTMASSPAALFAAGFFAEAGLSAWRVRKSTDEGSTWLTLDEMTGLSSNSAAN